MNMKNFDENHPSPLYYQLQQAIIEKITNKEYLENSQIPTEKELVHETGLSRTTVRQAVENLVNEGYLEKRRGIGTFVKSPSKKLWDLANLKSFRDAFESKGGDVCTKLLSIEKIPPTQVLEKIFGENFSSYYKLERLRYVDKIPLILVTTYIPEEYVNGLESYDLSNQSLFEIMVEDYDHTINYAEKEFRVKKAIEKEAKFLAIEKNDPIQNVKTVTYNNNNIPIEYSNSRDRGDMSVYRVRVHKKSD